ncbi:hypothetical protein AYO20_04891 [Fonsecaea nubica]|uniref:Uncharacterized protein n=1 Tax=Fonsecaea nubica TaxID=856822 RepID=A0A178D3J2_9EURO|nr:hypothetical protein AYO20_04891 [Fonsecaea nubica]OAL35741.1 hypothetical protein AYO20_04891 [Fonsecaea nubica]
MTTLLSLPVEVRENIYRFSLPRQQLKLQAFCDPEWSDAEKPAGIPALFFVNKTISAEAAPIFYSRAVLNITPPSLSSFLASCVAGTGPNINLALALDLEFSSCPRRHLQRITESHVYGRQRQVLSAEAYEALLRWLVDNTAVQTIHLSWRLMTRLRGARVDLKAAFNLYTAAASLSLVRKVYVYSTHPRSSWESTRYLELKKALNGLDLPEVQVYVLGEGGQHDALLDPRWDARKSDDAERRDMVHQISSWFDSLRSTLPPSKERSIATNEPRLYQVFCIFRHVANTPSGATDLLPV